MNDGYRSNLSVLTHTNNVWIKVTTIMDKQHNQSFHLVITSFPNSGLTSRQCDNQGQEPTHSTKSVSENRPVSPGGHDWLAGAWADRATIGLAGSPKDSSTLARRIPLKSQWLQCFSPNQVYKRSQDAHPGENRDILWYREQKEKGSGGTSLDFRRKMFARARDICNRSQSGSDEGGSSQTSLLALPTFHLCSGPLQHATSIISLGAGGWSQQL